ncbi:MAG TPA: PD-(D/E)XK nuclease family protein [Smithellaceae bacterium]|nr:PD-(D/E)XK nuclease family protein [Smithellaceae bacterium]
MKLSEFRKGPHLSASAIAEYMECSLSYRFSRIDQLKPEFKSDNMEFGSCIHQALADFHQERMMGTILTMEQLQERFIYHWTIRAFDNTEIKYGPENSFDKFLEKGQALLETYHDHFSDENVTVIAIEEPFRFNIENLPVPVVGVMDLVEEDHQGNIIITDFKSVAKSYTENDVSRNPQLTLYHLFCRSNGYAGRNIILKLDCLIKTKTPQFKRYYTARDKQDEMKAVKKIQEVWKGISKGIFIPNDTSWKCNECFYKTACNAWYREEAA